MTKMMVYPQKVMIVWSPYDDNDDPCSDAPVCVSQGQAVGAAKGEEIAQIWIIFKQDLILLQKMSYWMDNFVLMLTIYVSSHNGEQIEYLP